MVGLNEPFLRFEQLNRKCHLNSMQKAIQYYLISMENSIGTILVNFCRTENLIHASGTRLSTGVFFSLAARI
jgi:hypothetical protein